METIEIIFALYFGAALLLPVFRNKPRAVPIRQKAVRQKGIRQIPIRENRSEYIANQQLSASAKRKS